MTFDPGLGGVPLPREDLQFPSLYEPFDNRADSWQANTGFGTVAEYVSFYERFMAAHGWTEVTEERMVAMPGGWTAESVPMRGVHRGTHWLVWRDSAGKRIGVIVGQSDDHGGYISITINNQYNLLCPGGLNCVPAPFNTAE